MATVLEVRGDEENRLASVRELETPPKIAPHGTIDGSEAKLAERGPEMAQVQIKWGVRLRRMGRGWFSRNWER